MAHNSLLLVDRQILRNKAGSVKLLWLYLFIIMSSTVQKFVLNWNSFDLFSLFYFFPIFFLFFFRNE